MSKLILGKKKWIFFSLFFAFIAVAWCRRHIRKKINKHIPAGENDDDDEKPNMGVNKK